MYVLFACRVQFRLTHNVCPLQRLLVFLKQWLSNFPLLVKPIHITLIGQEPNPIRLSSTDAAR